jgi:SPP1 family predicted phage head-tail adaptor
MTDCQDSIGALRHRVTLEAPARAEAEGGTATTTWTTVAELWAEIKPRPQREIVAADAIKGRITHVVRVRFRSDIDATHRFRLGTRIFEIRSVHDEREEHRYSVCGCEEETP